MYRAARRDRTDAARDRPRGQGAAHLADAGRALSVWGFGVDGAGRQRDGRDVIKKDIAVVPTTRRPRVIGTTERDSEACEGEFADDGGDHSREYRPEIDGLACLAVMQVVFTRRVRVVACGFLGVEIVFRHQRLLING